MRSTTLFIIAVCTFNSVMHHKDKESRCTRYNLNLYFHSQFITEYLSLQNITWSHPTLFLHLLRSLFTASSSWHLNLPVLCLATSHVVHYRHSSRTSLVISLPTQYSSLVTMCFPWPQHFNFNTFALMHSLYYVTISSDFCSCFVGLDFLCVWVVSLTLGACYCFKGTVQVLFFAWGSSL